jgi:hypothetical protein
MTWSHLQVIWEARPQIHAVLRGDSKDPPMNVAFPMPETETLYCKVQLDRELILLDNNHARSEALVREVTFLSSDMEEYWRREYAKKFKTDMTTAVELAVRATRRLNE